MLFLQPASSRAGISVASAPRALFAGLAAHSFMALDRPLSASFGMVLGAAAHAVGWPIPRGGAQSISDALAACFTALGGRITTSKRIRHLADLPACDLTLCDLSPAQLLTLADQPDQPSGNRLSPGYRRRLGKYQYGPGAFKVDFALSRPIPWNAPDCLLAATVHVGGTLTEIEASEAAMASGRHADRPFVLVAQPTLFDPSRAPALKHIAWAYCHVPNGASESESDVMLDRIEQQIERFAAGFRSSIQARHVLSPLALEEEDANLIGGDIVGGAKTCASSSFAPPGASTEPRRPISTSAPPPLHPAAASTACAAPTPPASPSATSSSNFSRLTFRADQRERHAKRYNGLRTPGVSREAIKGRANAPKSGAPGILRDGPEWFTLAL